MEIKQRIFKAIESGKAAHMNSGEIFKLLKVTPDRKKLARRALDSLCTDGDIVRSNDGTYATPEQLGAFSGTVLANASAMAEAFAEKGYKIVSGGTDNHLMLIDLRTKFPELTGKVAEKELGKADITINKNMVPFDSRSPFQTSGIRIGTPAITSRGFVEKDMESIVNLIDMVLNNAASHLDLIAGKTEEGREEYEEVLAAVRRQVRMKVTGMPLNRY